MEVSCYANSQDAFEPNTHVYIDFQFKYCFLHFPIIKAMNYIVKSKKNVVSKN